MLALSSSSSSSDSCLRFFLYTFKFSNFKLSNAAFLAAAFLRLTLLVVALSYTYGASALHSLKSSQIF